MELLLGADPEVFVKQQGRFVSAHGLIPGTKKNPHKVERGAVQVDGMALEYNIEPVGSDNEWVHNHATVMRQLASMVPTYDIAITPVAMFDRDVFDAAPDEAKELGCDPDYNAYTSRPNVKPGNDLPMRTAAGHIHMGWTNGANPFDPAHLSMCESLVRQLDFYLALPSLYYDGDVLRRSMYGAAGAYRPKPYGVEYRVLSNRWLAEPELQLWAFRATKAAIEQLIAGNSLIDTIGDCQSIINHSDVPAALEICRAHQIEVPGYAA